MVVSIPLAVKLTTRVVNSKKLPFMARFFHILQNRLDRLIPEVRQMSMDQVKPLRKYVRKAEKLMKSAAVEVAAQPSLSHSDKALISLVQKYQDLSTAVNDRYWHLVPAVPATLELWGDAEEDLNWDSIPDGQI